MDFPQGNDIPIGNSIDVQLGKNGNQGLGTNSQTVWTSKDGMWNKEASVDANIDSNHAGRQLQLGNEPPNKRSKYFSSEDLASSDRLKKAMGKIFYKTRLCSKFQSGTCSYYSCNFAHCIEELRRPPPNWQEILAEYKEEKGASEPREECLRPNVGLRDEAREPYIGKPRLHGKKFNFLHDEKSEVRESAAVCLVSSSGYGNNRFNSSLNPSTWKTNICYKWDMNGYCSYGDNCHFAHGAAELRRPGALFVEKDSHVPKQGEGSATTSVIAASAPGPSARHSVGDRTVTPGTRLSSVMQSTGERAVRWKGPNKISKIYGDWIDDL